MSLFDKFKELTRPFDDDDDDDFMDEAPQRAEARKPAPQAPSPSRPSSPVRGGYPPPSSSPLAEFEDKLSTSAAASRVNKVVNIHATTQVQVVLVKPERFENAADIADHLREKRTVLMNLEQTNKDIARRLIDFLSGVAYAQDGKIKKVAISTYIITPYNVDIMGDLIDELENNGLYF